MSHKKKYVRVDTVGSARRRGDAKEQYHRIGRAAETIGSFHAGGGVAVQVGSGQVLQPVRGGRQSERQLCRERHGRPLGERVPRRAHMRSKVWLEGFAGRPVRQPSLRGHRTAQRDRRLRLKQPLHQGDFSIPNRNRNRA